MQVVDLESQSVAQQLTRLAKLFESRQASTLMQQTLRKLFTVEIADARRQLDVLGNDLAEFEERYGMPSADFFTQFDNGELGDDMDYVEWASLYQMYERVRERLELLAGME